MRLTVIRLWSTDSEGWETRWGVVSLGDLNRKRKIVVWQKKENNKQNQGHPTLLRLTKNFMFLKMKTCNPSGQHPVFKLHWWELSSSTCSYSRRKTEQASNVSPNENSFSENQPQSRRKPWHNIPNCIKYLQPSICGPGARIRSAYIKEKMKW